MRDYASQKQEQLVSVSIVTYNSSDEIDSLLKSLENSSVFNNMSVYVVDNASSDDTLNKIKGFYPWVKVVANSKNEGFGRAHNRVIRSISSRYHIIVNPDIEFSSEVIAKAIEYMDDNPDVAVLTPYVFNVDGTQQFLPKKNPTFKYLFGGTFENRFEWSKKLRDDYTRKNDLSTTPIEVEFCTGAFMFIRTSMLQRVKGFDERYFLHFEDADLTRELRQIGKAIYNPSIQVTHKWHRDNKKLNRSFFAALKSMIIYMLKWRFMVPDYQESDKK